MNKIYRSVWNAALGTWVAAPETTRSKRKGSQQLAVCAVLLGSSILLGSHASAACDTSTSGIGVCDGSAESTEFRTVTDLDNREWTFKNEAQMSLFDDASISSGTHTFEDGILLINTQQAITGGIFNFIQAATSASDNLYFGSNSYANQTAAVTGGTFNFYDFASGSITNTNTVDGATFNLYNNSFLSLDGRSTKYSTFNLYDDSSLRSVNAALSDATLTLNDTSTLFLETGAIYRSNITMNDASKLRLLEDNVYAAAEISFTSADANIDLAGNQLSVELLTSLNVGDGRIYSSAASVFGGTRMPTLYVRAEDIDPDVTYKFSALLDSQTGDHPITVQFSNGNWEVQGHASNTAKVIFYGGEYTVTGFQYNGIFNRDTHIKGISSYNDLYVMGSMSPGIGTINVADTMQLNQAVLNVAALDADGPNNSSRWEVGTLALDSSSTIKVEAENSTWNVQREYEVIRINDGFLIDSMAPWLVNKFMPSQVSANFAYLTPTLSTVADNANDPNGPGSIMLTLARNDGGGSTGGGSTGGGSTGGGSTGGGSTSGGSTGGGSTGGGSTGGGSTGTPVAFASLAQSANQIAVANAVDSLPSSHPVYNHVLTLPVGAPVPTFNSLSGEVHASILSGLKNLTSHTHRLSLGNMRHTLNAGLNPMAMTAQVGGTQGSSGLPAFGDKPAWVELVGNWQKIDGDSNAAELKQNTAGVFAGYDNELSHGWHLGGSLGYTKTNSDISARSSEADINSYSATLYGGKAFALDTQRQLNLMAGISYTYHDVEGERRVAGLNQKLKSDYDAHTAQVFGEVGYVIGQPDRRYVEPFAGLTVSYLSADSFKESGGSAALKAKSENDTQTVSTLGVRAQSDIPLGNWGGLVRGSVAWQHAFGDEHLERTMAFTGGGQEFTARGVAIARDTAVVGAGALLNISPNAAVSLDYEGRFASDVRDHGASLKVQWNF